MGHKSAFISFVLKSFAVLFLFFSNSVLHLAEDQKNKSRLSTMVPPDCSLLKKDVPKLLSEWSSGDEYFNTEAVILCTNFIFLDGTRGALVTVGTGGPSHGYIMLFGEYKSGSELIEVQSGPFWGETCDSKSNDFSKHLSAGHSWVSVYTSRDRQTKLLRVEGYSHPGTGMFVCGIFQLLDIQNRSIITAFEGTEYGIANYPGGFRSKSSYDFSSVSKDGKSKIIETTIHCTPIQKKPEEYAMCFEGVECTTDLFFNNCKTDIVHYVYNGKKFVRQTK